MPAFTAVVVVCSLAVMPDARKCGPGPDMALQYKELPGAYQTGADCIRAAQEGIRLLDPIMPAEDVIRIFCIPH